MAIKKNGTKNDGIKYEVIEKCGVISERSGGYNLELRYISWNGNEPKYDLRQWKVDDEGEKMSKGITLTGEELEELGKIIAAMMKED